MTMAMAMASFGRTSVRIIDPKTIAERALPTSTPGTGIPNKPSMVPTAIIMGNAIDRIHRTGLPSCAS